MDFLIYVLEDTQETAQFDVIKTRQSYYRNLSFLSSQLTGGAVLDQVSPDVFVVSSKADDKFIDFCSDSSMDLS